MKNKSDINLLKQIGIPVFLLLILWLVGKFFPFRIDLTEEKRYSLHPATIEVLQQIDEPLEVEILLTGNLPGGMRRLQRSVEETIRTFNAYSNKKIAFFLPRPNDITRRCQGRLYRRIDAII